MTLSDTIDEALAWRLRLTADAHRTPLTFLSEPLDPASRPKGLAEISAVARRARRQLHHR